MSLDQDPGWVELRRTYDGSGLLQEIDLDKLSLGGLVYMAAPRKAQLTEIGLWAWRLIDRGIVAICPVPAFVVGQSLAYLEGLTPLRGGRGSDLAYAITRRSCSSVVVPQIPGWGDDPCVYADVADALACGRPVKLIRQLPQDADAFTIAEIDRPGGRDF